MAPALPIPRDPAAGSCLCCCETWISLDRLACQDRDLLLFAMRPPDRVFNTGRLSAQLLPDVQAKTGKAKLTKGKFTWITEAGRQERWIVASCGAFTVLFNFRCGAPATNKGRAPDCARTAAMKPRHRDTSPDSFSSVPRQWSKLQGLAG